MPDRDGHRRERAARTWHDARGEHTAFAIARRCTCSPTHLVAGKQTVRLPVRMSPFTLTDKNHRTILLMAALVTGLIVVGVCAPAGWAHEIGVRENERAARSITSVPTKAKLTAYALGGFVAGLGGRSRGLVVTSGYKHESLPGAGLVRHRRDRGDRGIGSTRRRALGAGGSSDARVLAGQRPHSALHVENRVLLILLYIPGGFTQVTYWFRDQLLRRLERRMGSVPSKVSAEPPASLALAVSGKTTTNSDGSALHAHGIRVAFGGVVAVNDVDFKALPGQVVGLIGANGAGKSTLLNAIGGFVPSRGRVELLGEDVTSKAAHQRAERGLGGRSRPRCSFPS